MRIRCLYKCIILFLLGIAVNVYARSLYGNDKDDLSSAKGHFESIQSKSASGNFAVQSDTTQIYILPAVVNKTIFQTFPIAVKLSRVTNLFSCAFDLNYNPSLLEFISVSERRILNAGGTVQTLFQSYNDPLSGRIVIGISRIGNSPGVTAASDDTLLIVNFKTKSAGTSIINFEHIGLLLPDGTSIIPAKSSSGIVNIANNNQNTALLFSPVSVQPEVGAAFDIEVQTGPINDLFALITDVVYNPSKIVLLDVSEGTFLNENGSSATSFMKSIDNQVGRGIFGITRLAGPASGVSSVSNQRLLTLRFKCISAGANSILFENSGMTAPDGLTHYQVNPGSAQVNGNFQVSNAELFFIPDTIRLKADSIKTVELKVDSVSNAFACSGTFLFDPAQVAIQQINEGDFFNSDGGSTSLLSSIDTLTGQITFGITRLGSQNGGISSNLPRTILKIILKKKAAGSSVFRTRNFQIMDPSANSLGSLKQPVLVILSPVEIPSVPILALPLNNSTGNVPPITLKWNKTLRAEHYTVQLALDSLFSSLIVNDTMVIDTSKQITGLAVNSKYYWRILAKNIAGAGSWSVVWNFWTNQLCKNVTVNSGWNLISVPLTASNMNAAALFPTANTPAYWFSNGYVTSASLSNGRAYWLRFASADSSSVCGASVLQPNQVPLLSGWNLIGIYDNDIAVSGVTTTPANIINSYFYGYLNGYVVPTVLKVGNGYWIRANAAGVMNINAAPAKSAGQLEVKTEKNWARIIVTDSRGSSSLLYAAKAEISIDQFALPPVPPAGIFDVRFASQSSVENLSDAKVISISGAAYPVEIRVEGVDLLIKDIATGKLINSLVKSGSSIVIADENITSIEVSAVTKPIAFELQQNYPNPFNPSTIIRFGLPENARVSITIYNQIGEQVAELANGQMEAGYHQVSWNAANMSSGVYFYELKAGNFKSMKKLLLMK